MLSGQKQAKQEELRANLRFAEATVGGSDRRSCRLIRGAGLQHHTALGGASAACPNIHTQLHTSAAEQHGSQHNEDAALILKDHNV
ncbi:hypothetical protein CesoFtcFv8_012585 [Champsocephalus esox]|uniref:Uncharacterized protein n=1 Tax=Champsocephalus esox TaxID=159716 RepID=A0AAN8BV78_9TELE|nr:hypothetical protein CesoFtcFv8_012585 [Champsocephalus esox]